MGEPLAYHGVPLAEHLARVALAADRLMAWRLRAKTSYRLAFDRAAGIEDGLYRATMLAAALHDLGKASSIYQRRGGKSFWLHEHVGGLLLAEASKEAAEADRGRAALLWLAAMAVSRHHSAMEGRHPRSLSSAAMRAGGSPRELRWIGKAVQELDPGVVSRLASRLGLDWLLGDLEAGLERLRARSGSPERLASLLKSLAEPKPPGWLGPGVLPGAAQALVNTASGSVIVADIIVADSERRSSDEGASPVYVRYWVEELSAQGTLQRLRMLEQRGELLAEARRLLSSLKP